MNKVYRHRPAAVDEYLGHVDANGKVYETRLGPDHYVGRVELDTGKIFESRMGPDENIGRVELDSGKVYLRKLGPDTYLGRVEENGKLYYHRAIAPDIYLGRVEDMISFAHGGAAFLLLVKPVYDEKVMQEKEQAKEAGKEDVADDEKGSAAAPA